MKRKYVFDESKSTIKESTNDECLTLVVKPKKRTCKYCNKSFESMQTEILFWKDKNNYRRQAWFCREHFSSIKALLNENKRLM